MSNVKAVLVKLSCLGCYDVLKVSKVPIKEIIGVYGMPGKKDESGKGILD